MKRLILTNLKGNKSINKNSIALGHWVNYEKMYCLNYHWSNKKKLVKDYKYLTKLSEKFLNFFTNNLNYIHQEKRSLKYWRIILSPWLNTYISSMYDRWETINRLEKKKSSFTCDYLYNRKIFTNVGTSDYIRKVTSDDLWNHSNFIRIIKFKKQKKIILKKSYKSYIIKNYLEKKTETSFIINFFDKIFSHISILINSTIIENFYISKKDYLNLCLSSYIFPGIFKNFFSSKNLYNCKINNELRNKLFKYKSKKKDFNFFLFECLKEDFPVTYLENYKILKSEICSKGFQNKNIKKIFSMTSFIMNEVFKIWLANRVEHGTKFIIVSHGGCLNPKLNGYLNYFPKIADKVITRKKPLTHKETQMPIFLRENPYQNLNEKKQKIYIFDCVPVNYPCKIQSWPFINDYKRIIRNTENLINCFSLKEKKNIFYRSLWTGKNIGVQIKRKIPSIKLCDCKKIKFKDIKNEIKLAICMYPETVIVDLITSNIPTVLYIPKDLYLFDRNSLKMINYLKKNKLYFDNLKDLKSHLNIIKDSPYTWWTTRPTQTAIKKFQKHFFYVEQNYIFKWKKLIKTI